jgi:hypothetical protein
MGSIERFTPGKAAGAGAAAAIAQTGIGSGDQAIAHVVFALIATVGVAVPVVMFFALPDHRGQADRRRHRRLQRLTISAGTPRSQHPAGTIWTDVHFVTLGHMCTPTGVAACWRT